MNELILNSSNIKLNFSSYIKLNSSRNILLYFLVFHQQIVFLHFWWLRAFKRF